MKDDVLILCYHAVSERWDADLATTPAQLRTQLESLMRRGYEGATFTEAATVRRSGRVLAVTFDDAFTSVLELAQPILASLGLPGTVFAVTDFADTGGRLSWPGISQWADGPFAVELEGMSWSQLRWLATQGWEVGSHTRSHPRLTELDDDALAGELRGSRESCEKSLGTTCRSVAYPYGDVDARVVRAAAGAGYHAAAALPGRLHAPTALEWPRIGIYSPDSFRRFRLKASPLVRKVRVVVERRPLIGAP